ncbi:unnamed protein product [Protopolystoma xenopodis]|uniref:FAS1 domain-containing protein n=1 Tax=Protopolystoma xenopodis TaxID=117903 RepID=A0A448XEZ1_9PLAT|nr:unnamed protein product [Protopolystoma xenopodis]
MSRLQAVLDVSDFLSDLPSDLKSTLGYSKDSDTEQWYTVFAPTNNAWRKAKHGLNKSLIEALARNHVLDRMICSGAITRNSNFCGPNWADSCLSMGVKPSGTKYVVDRCGSEASILKPDLMARNGVVHVIDGVIFSPECEFLKVANKNEKKI